MADIPLDNVSACRGIDQRRCDLDSLVRNGMLVAHSMRMNLHGLEQP